MYKISALVATVGPGLSAGQTSSGNVSDSSLIFCRPTRQLGGNNPPHPLSLASQSSSAPLVQEPTWGASQTWPRSSTYLLRYFLDPGLCVTFKDERQSPRSQECWDKRGPQQNGGPEPLSLEWTAQWGIGRGRQAIQLKAGDGRASVRHIPGSGEMGV